jgi:hypothetical protein
MASIPVRNLTDEQYDALRDFIIRHREEGTYSATPIRLARVLAYDKPATLLQTPPEISTSRDDYLVSLLDRIGLPYRQIDGIPGWIVSPTEWRLDLLPTVKHEFRQPAAYHKRLGVAFGYPSDAIEYFIQKDTSEPAKVDLVTAGKFDANEVAYTRFICYAYPKTAEKFEHYISIGIEIRQRINQLARSWNMPELDLLADDAYNDELRAIKSGGRDNIPNRTIKFDWKRDQLRAEHSQN